ncbi:MAG: serine hydrolase domain-containing protein [Fimbriimonas sp.]
MDAKPGSPSRRDVLKGIAAGGMSFALGPVLATPPMKDAKSLPRGSAAALGIRPEAIAAFLDEVNEKVGGLHSMMLLRHGKVAAEAWWAPYAPSEPHVLYSLSKSFTSTAIGLAVAEGRLSVEDKVVSFFPDKLPEKVSENLAAMRVKDLLTMSTGHEQEPARENPDWVKSFLAAPVPKAPGTHFLYNTSATHILAAIVQKLTGQRVLTYLTPRLFEPLGIEGATWEQSPAGVDAGGYGLKVRTEDIAKFGQLYLQKGKWNGKPLLPEAWVEEATKRQVSNGDPAQANDWSQGYGYQFWRCQHGHYRGDGAFGQYCVVMPAHDAVLAITSGVGDMGAILKAAWTHLLSGMTEKADKTGEAALKGKLAKQVVPGPAGAANSPTAVRVSGKTYTLAPNAEGLKSVKLTFQGDRCTIETVRAADTARVVSGTKHWVGGKLLEADGLVHPIAAQGAWATEDRYVVTTCGLDSPHAWTETYAFEGDTLAIVDRHLNVWFGDPKRPDLKGTRG